MDPISIIGLIETVVGIVKKLYDTYEAFWDAPENIRQLCDELFALQDVLARISSNLTFRSTVNHADKYDSRTRIKEMISRTAQILEDLLKKFAKPQSGKSRKWLESSKQRVGWLLDEKKIEEERQKIERLKDYFSLVLSVESLEEAQTLHNDFVTFSNQILQLSRPVILNWISANDYHSRHVQLVNSHLPGTGRWFLEGNRFSEWINPDKHPSRILWLQGKSGSGKSCLISRAIETAIEKWKSDTDSVVLYHYCSFQDMSSQSLAALLGCLIVQLCDKKSGLWKLVEEAYLENDHGLGGANPMATPTSKLRSIFGTLSLGFSKVAVFLDAPNESSESVDLIEALASAASEHPFMQVCISSTPNLDIKWLQARGSQFVLVKMDTIEHEQDIEPCIRAHLKHHKSLSSLPHNLNEEIVRALVQKSEGSFRYVACHLTALETKQTFGEVKKAIKTLPETLSDSYHHLLRGIPPHFRIRVRRLLRWLIIQTRPLTLSELEVAVALENDLSQDNLLLPGKMDEILKVCGSLVQYDSTAETVSLGHSSVKEFLLSEKFINQKYPDLKDLSSGRFIDMITSALKGCALYLTQDPLREGYVADIAGRLKQFPFLSYCAKSLDYYWKFAASANMTTFDPDLTRSLKLVCHANNKHGGFWGSFLQVFEPAYTTPPYDSAKMPTPLGFAAARGWTFMIDFMLKNGLDSDLEIASGYAHYTPLTRAILYGQEATVRLLLARGARFVRNDDVRDALEKLPSDFRELLTDSEKSQFQVKSQNHQPGLSGTASTSTDNHLHGLVRPGATKTSQLASSRPGIIQPMSRVAPIRGTEYNQQLPGPLIIQSNHHPSRPSYTAPLSTPLHQYHSVYQPPKAVVPRNPGDSVQ